MAITALVLGIVSIVLSFIPAIQIVGAIAGVIGIILAALAKKNNPDAGGLATAGLVLSIIGLVLSLLFFLFCGSCLTCGAAGAADQLLKSLG